MLLHCYDFNCSETGEFLEILLKWWNIVRNSSVIKGQTKLDDWSKPFYDTNDDRLEFLI